MPEDLTHAMLQGCRAAKDALTKDVEKLVKWLTQKDDKIKALEKENLFLKVENEELKRAIRYYGGHNADLQKVYCSEHKCYCGFAEVLRRINGKKLDSGKEK